MSEQPKTNCSDCVGREDCAHSYYGVVGCADFEPRSGGDGNETPEAESTRPLSPTERWAAWSAKHHSSRPLTPWEEHCLKLSQSRMFQMAARLQQKYGPVLEEQARVIREIEERMQKPDESAVDHQAMRLLPREADAPTQADLRQVVQLLTGLHGMVAEMLTELKQQGTEQQRHGVHLSNIDDATDEMNLYPPTNGNGDLN